MGFPPVFVYNKWVLNKQNATTYLETKDCEYLFIERPKIKDITPQNTKNNKKKLLAKPLFSQ